MADTHENPIDASADSQNPYSAPLSETSTDNPNHRSRLFGHVVQNVLTGGILGTVMMSAQFGRPWFGWDTVGTGFLIGAALSAVLTILTGPQAPE